MPPQQHDRPLDLIDDVLDFRAHDVFHWRQQAAFESLSSTIDMRRVGDPARTIQ
jgi:hypothetical protein